MDIIDSYVKRFKKENKIFTALNWKKLECISKKNNWILKTYSEADDLINEHNLRDLIKGRRAFTYKYKNEIIILYRDDLDDFNRIHAICHEIGHIYLNHDMSINDNKDDLESEADHFADLLIKRNRITLPVISASVTLCLVFGFIAMYNCFGTSKASLEAEYTSTTAPTETIAVTLKQSQSTTTHETTTHTETTTTVETTSQIETMPVTVDTSDDNNYVYISHSGDKYHRADCYQIDINNCTAVTLEQAESLGYEPCKTCRPIELTGYDSPEQEVESSVETQGVDETLYSENDTIESNFIPINLNSASFDDLMTVPGMDEKTATGIINLRNSIHYFSDIHELLYVEDMNADKFVQISKYLCV